MTIQHHAGEVLETLNKVGPISSRLELPAGLPDRFRVAWALLRLCYDHASSIAWNFHSHGVELAGSGYALLRPMNDALKRGTWFGFCASDEETQQFLERDKLPDRNLAAEIEACPPFDTYRIFSELHANASKKFHSFTHGGAQAVGAYTMGDGIGAAFPEGDVIEMLNHVEAVAIMAVHVMSMICSRVNEELAIGVQNDLAAIIPARAR